jgi:hypothetical protein
VSAGHGISAITDLIGRPGMSLSLTAPAAADRRLFLRGVNPWQPTGSVPDLGALVNLARRLLEANKERATAT